SDNSLAQCFMEIRKALKDEDQRIIKTVPRRGYLFNVSVERSPGRAFQTASAAVQPIPPIGVPQLVDAPVREARLKRLVGVGGLITILVASMLWLFLRARTPTPATPAVLAVLPFQSLVQSEPDEFLELGMADAIITRLANVRKLVVRPTSAVRIYTD